MPEISVYLAGNTLPVLILPRGRVRLLWLITRSDGAHATEVSAGSTPTFVVRSHLILHLPACSRASLFIHGGASHVCTHIHSSSPWKGFHFHYFPNLNPNCIYIQNLIFLASLPSFAEISPSFFESFVIVTSSFLKIYAEGFSSPWRTDQMVSNTTTYENLDAVLDFNSVLRFSFSLKFDFLSWIFRNFVIN